MGPNGWTANSPSTAEHRDLRLATSNSRMLKSSRLQWRWFSWFIISNNWWHQNMLPRGLRFTPGALPGIIRMIVTTKKNKASSIDRFIRQWKDSQKMPNLIPYSWFVNPCSLLLDPLLPANHDSNNHPSLHAWPESWHVVADVEDRWSHVEPPGTQNYSVDVKKAIVISHDGSMVLVY